MYLYSFIINFEPKIEQEGYFNSFSYLPPRIELRNDVPLFIQINSKFERVSVLENSPRRVMVASCNMYYRLS